VQYQCEALVLRTIAYGDTSIIVHAYTQQWGKVVYMVKGVRTTKAGASAKGKLLQAANLLMLEGTFVPHKHFQLCNTIYLANYNLPQQRTVLRNAVALFVCELIDKIITEPEQNIELFEWLKATINTINICPINTLSYLPIKIVIEYCALLGFGILDVYESNKPYLHMHNSVFVPTPLADTTTMMPQSGQLISLLNQQLPLSQLEDLTFTKLQKATALKDVLLYLQYHLPHQVNLQVPSILSTIFN
jgi:DNA repair protein RecO (recombination protein O)